MVTEARVSCLSGVISDHFHSSLTLIPTLTTSLQPHSHTYYPSSHMDFLTLLSSFPSSYLSPSVTLSLQLFCFMNLYSFFKAQINFFSLQCFLWSPQELITSSRGLLRYFVHICITYLTLCFAWLCMFLFSARVCKNHVLFIAALGTQQAINDVY